MGSKGKSTRACAQLYTPCGKARELPWCSALASTTYPSPRLCRTLCETSGGAMLCPGCIRCGHSARSRSSGQCAAGSGSAMQQGRVATAMLCSYWTLCSGLLTLRRLGPCRPARLRRAYATLLRASCYSQRSGTAGRCCGTRRGTPSGANRCELKRQARPFARRRVRAKRRWSRGAPNSARAGGRPATPGVPRTGTTWSSILAASQEPRSRWPRVLLARRRQRGETARLYQGRLCWRMCFRKRSARR
mmetsp:Transcript_9756/g.22603  ORF Transcript_9756/g.22603 Transcript_9756/m.22603 type:complete len:247 (+) Transcript_9756:298-1038(+)